jgi:hypothetical protein
MHCSKKVVMWFKSGLERMFSVHGREKYEIRDMKTCSICVSGNFLSNGIILELVFS